MLASAVVGFVAGEGDVPALAFEAVVLLLADGDLLSVVLACGEAAAPEYE